MAKFRHTRQAHRPLKFRAKSGKDLYLYSMQALLNAIGRKTPKTIYQWEQRGIIPEEYVIFIKKGGVTKRYYTERTIVKMRRIFNKAHNPIQKAKKKITATARLKRIHKLFREEYTEFAGAKFLGVVGSYREPDYASVPKDAPQIHHATVEIGEGEDEVIEQDDYKDQGNWSK